MIETIQIKNPFDRKEDRVIELLSFENKTLAEILPLPNDLQVSVSVNGSIIPRTEWGLYLPQDGDQIVIVAVVGKGDTEKQILTPTSKPIFPTTFCNMVKFGFFRDQNFY